MTWKHGQGVQFLGFGFVSGGPFHCLGSALIAGRRQKTSIDLHHFPPTALPPLPSTALHCPPLPPLSPLSPLPPPYQSLRDRTPQTPMGKQHGNFPEAVHSSDNFHQQQQGFRPNSPRTWPHQNHFQLLISPHVDYLSTALQPKSSNP
jgi:hypothetical protein